MSDLSQTTAAILCGGLGTRLRSVVADRPKCLAEVSGRPFIAYLLDQLNDAGVRDVVLCTGFMGESVLETLRDSYRDMRLEYSQELLPLGTGGGLRLALAKIKSDELIVMNGDSYCDANLQTMAAWHRKNNSPATLLLSETDDTHRFGRVDVDNNGAVVCFREKVEVPGRGWVNAGIYFLRRDLIASIPAKRNVSIERDVFPQWIGNGLHGFRGDGKLWDIGIPDAFAAANREFVKSLSI